MASFPTFRGARKALLIGNNYPGEDSQLPSCVNDMVAMTDVLTSQQCAFDATPQQNLGLVDMQGTISDFGDTLSDGDCAVFYFSGHGVMYDGVLFLCPCGMRDLKKESDVQRQCVSMHDVQESLFTGCGVKGIKIMIIDACRSRSFERVRTKSFAGLKSRNFAALQKLPQSANSMVIYATAEATVAYAGSRLSLFTKEFVEAIPTPGLELSGLTRLVRRKLVAQNAIPHNDDAMLDEFYFVLGSETANHNLNSSHGSGSGGGGGGGGGGSGAGSRPGSRWSMRSSRGVHHSPSTNRSSSGASKTGGSPVVSCSGSFLVGERAERERGTNAV
jgi:uncharacterized caspase-like protein